VKYLPKGHGRSSASSRNLSAGSCTCFLVAVATSELPGRDHAV
jgi:hypothetical protein